VDARSQRAFDLVVSSGEAIKEALLTVGLPVEGKALAALRKRVQRHQKFSGPTTSHAALVTEAPIRAPAHKPKNKKTTPVIVKLGKGKPAAGFRKNKKQKAAAGRLVHQKRQSRKEAYKKVTLRCVLPKTICP
jgi:hypothetical protein